jgi:hypothetical protein
MKHGRVRWGQATTWCPFIENGNPLCEALAKRGTKKTIEGCTTQT